MGLFSSIASIFTGNSSAKAATNAANQQVGYDQKAIDGQNAQLATTTGNYQPYLKAGTSALGGQSDLLGLNGGDAQQSSISALQASPLYQSLFRNGQEAVLQNGAATGGLRGGNIQDSLANFGSNTLSQVIQNQLANLGGLSSQGAGMTQNLGALGASNAATNSGLYDSQGNATARGILGKAAGQNQMITGAAGAATSIANAIPGVKSLGIF